MSGPPPLPLVKFLAMWVLLHVGDWLGVERCLSVRNKGTVNFGPEFKFGVERRVSSAEERHKLCWKPDAVMRLPHPLNTRVANFSRLKEKGEGLSLPAVLQQGHANVICLMLHLLKLLLQFVKRA